MSVSKVLRLAEYRARRTDRTRLAEVLHSRDPQRRSVFDLLTEIADLSTSDRAATVWVDEYGSGLIHPHVVLDHLSDRPRRDFSPEPLRGAWELGVPAAVDCAGGSSREVPATFAVSLGSDGTRAWFLVAESLGSRPPLTDEVRDRVMFLAGECSAVLLHRDLDTVVGRRGGAAQARRFAGWPILEDLEGLEPEDAESRHIAQRFIVGRLARMLLDEDLAMAADRLEELVERALSELETGPGGDEVEGWRQTLEALRDYDLDAVSSSLVSIGQAAEAQGHFNGALELYRCAYDVATAIGAPEAAVDAAQFQGRTLRRGAEWAAAKSWYRTAFEIAQAVPILGRAARVLVGHSLIDKELGRFPAVREQLDRALGLATRSGERDAVAIVHQTLLGVEQAAGDIAKALDHGWTAVASFESQVERTRCIASLAGALAEYGDRAAAEDAWTVVARTSDETYYRVYAHDALAYLAALRGDREAFERNARACDALGWETGQLSAKAEILYYRGLSHQALGDLELAEEWLRRALAFAEAHDFNRVLFESEEALRSLSRSRDEDRVPGPVAPPELREGLRAMRQELVEVET